MTDVTVMNEPPQGNQPEARQPDGTLKDQSNLTTTHTPPETKASTDGKSFINDKPPEAPVKEELKLDADGKPIVELKKEDVPKEGAPEKYADFKVPEGFKFDPE